MFRSRTPFSPRRYHKISESSGHGPGPCPSDPPELARRCAPRYIEWQLKWAAY